MALPELFNNPEVAGNLTPEGVRDTCRNWYPEIFEQLTGEKPTPENSYITRERKFAADNVENWVVICAWGDHSHPLKGFVKCIATLGGNRKYADSKMFMVRNERYAARDHFGYVIQPDDLIWQEETAQQD